MTLPRKTGLFTRTFLLFLLVPLTTVGLLTLIAIPRQRTLLLRSMESEIHGTLAAIVGINQSTFIQEDYAGLVEINALVIRENPGIQYLVTSRQGGTSILNLPGRWQEIDPSQPANQWLGDHTSRMIDRNPLTGERVFHYAFPVRFYDLEWGWVCAGLSMKAADAQIRRMYLGTLAMGTFYMALSIFLAWFFTRRLTAPLLNLKDAAERIGRGEWDVRASVHSGDEVEQLADSFNATAEALRRLNAELEARVEARTLELQRSEERYRLLLDNAAEAIFVLRDGRIRFWNPVLQQLTGYGLERLQGTVFAELVAEGDRMAFLDLLARAEASPTPVLREGLRMERQAEEPLWVDVTCVAIRWDQDPALLCFVQDISERRNLQGQLFRAQKMEAIGTLAGGIAHDFNNLLAGILGYVSILQAGKEPGTPEFEQLQTIEQQIDSARGLTRQLLGFARGGTYEMKPWDLNQIVQSAVDLYGRTKREIEVVQELLGEECVADCDRGQIEQVLINLFVNATQAMPEGGTLTVRTGKRAYPEDLTRPFGLPAGWYVEVEVRDTGIGMDEATQARIFDPFFTTKDLGGGSGLGLASVYGILKNHRGLIQVQSQVGRGSTFICALPLSKASVVAREKRRLKGTHKGEGTVLVVDDQEIIRTVSAAMLEMIGYGVLKAESGEEALALFQEHRDKIKLVLLDMIMPGMNGKETFHRLRALEPHLPVILASGYSPGGDVDTLLAEGCNGFIQKPFNVAKLAEKISQVLAPGDGAADPR
ncbi:MAG: response regulator [Geothrix sp.]|nr:response regulator [Geothrix sp.]